MANRNTSQFIGVAVAGAFGVFFVDAVLDAIGLTGTVGTLLALFPLLLVAVVALNLTRRVA